MKKILISLTALVCAVSMSAEGTVDDTMNPLITAMPSLSMHVLPVWVISA